MLLSWSLDGQNLGGIRVSVGARGAAFVGYDSTSALCLAREGSLESSCNGRLAMRRQKNQVFSLFVAGCCWPALVQEGSSCMPSGRLLLKR